jgi:RimJ/RimL family protein N-acetyltransferase
MLISTVPANSQARARSRRRLLSRLGENARVLATKRLVLRRLDEADAAAYLALISDTEAMRFVSSGLPPTAPEAAQSISTINARYEKDGFGVLGIEHRAEARLIGRVGFWVWDRTNWTGGHTWCELRDRAEIELGWALVRDTWGPRVRDRSGGRAARSCVSRAWVHALDLSHPS